MGARGAVIRRAVLDSNVAVSALLFDGRLVRLRHAWMAGDFRPLVSDATTAELLRVLSYPKFRLSIAEIEAVLVEYLPFTEIVDVGDVPSEWPGLEDPDDAIFLDLARAAQADYLVTGDLPLLAITPPEGCRILTPADFLRVLEAS